MGTKILIPVQITYIQATRVQVIRENYTREDQSDPSPWVYAGLVTQSTEWSYSSADHSIEEYAYPTTSKTSTWGSWTMLGDLKHRYRLKTETTVFNQMLVQFDTSAIPAGATAYLRLYATDGGDAYAYPDVYKITEDWVASTVTWNNKPEMAAALSSQTLPLNAWVSIDVSSALSAYGFALHDADYGSGANRVKSIPTSGDFAPQLVVTHGESSNVYVQTETGLKQSS